jgi:carbamoyltransferase
LADDKVIGWFEGRSEIGPRALGHRSILADPRKAENWQRVNEIKQRETWRPFAPAVLAEHARDWFDSIPLPSPHMLYTAQVKSDAVPAITHTDKSARIQTVDASAGAFHDVLRAFHERTGIPMVLNTSFNGPGEPIVESPMDAIRFFVGSSLEALYLEGRRITRR